MGPRFVLLDLVLAGDNALIGAGRAPRCRRNSGSGRASSARSGGGAAVDLLRAAITGCSSLPLALR